jgi:DNA-binding Xre family transcriptional regulator
MSTIAWRVDELVAKRGWSASRLARAASLDEKTVRNIIAGRATRVDLETIARLASALQVTPGALWALRPDPADAWKATAGCAGAAGREELLEALAGGGFEQPDSALERALRSP